MTDIDTDIDMPDREIVTTRLFAAPRELLWRAWTDPDHLRHWWGPKGFSNTFHEFDFKPGGVWRFVMHGPDGRDYDNENRFVEIDWLNRIVFDHVSHPKFRATALFEDADRGTRLTFRQLFETAEICTAVKRYALPANEENFDKLAVVLPTIDRNRRALTITRTFAAPLALVWEAWTDPKRVAQWWGPKGFTNPVCEWDARAGGAIHIVMRGPDGTDYPMRGLFRDVVVPRRLVFTNYPVDADDNPQIDGLTSVTFTARDGQTEMVLETRAIGLVPYASRMILGMGVGWAQSIDRLAALLKGA